MAGNSLFISYARRDMTPVNWLERLKLYLAPFIREGLVVWDDSRIHAGGRWREDIQSALEQATAAVLLVGPGFLASEFITTRELPALLNAAKTRGIKIYPLIIGYCGYGRSVLEHYQVFNDLESPLEALATKDQNKLLNDLSLTVDADLRRLKVTSTGQESTSAVYAVIREIAENLQDTRTAFDAQARRRDVLIEMMCSHLKVPLDREYENFFFRYFEELDQNERFQFDQIRSITERQLYQGNKNLLRVIEEHPQVLDELPVLVNLRQHLVFWLNKYEGIFMKTPGMCVLYAGVEDGVPFPDDVDTEVNNWLESHRHMSSDK